MCLIHRVDTRKMLKNSLAFIWTHSKRNYFQSPTRSLLVKYRRQVHRLKSEKKKSRQKRTGGWKLANGIGWLSPAR